MRNITATGKTQGRQNEGPKCPFQNRDPRLSGILPKSKIRRSVEEAWEIVVKNESLAGAIVNRLYLNMHIPFSDARQYVFLEMFRAALAWNPHKGPYPSFAFLYCRSVWREINNNERTIRVNPKLLGLIKNYRRFRHDNPKATIEEYAKMHRLGNKRAKAVEAFARRSSGREIIHLDEERPSSANNSPFTYRPAQYIIERLQINGSVSNPFPNPQQALEDKGMKTLVPLIVSSIPYGDTISRIRGLNGDERVPMKVIADEEGISNSAVGARTIREIRRLSELRVMRELADCSSL